MNRIGRHAINELRLLLYIKRRYWFETVMSFSLITLLFFGLIYSIIIIGGLNFDSGALDTLIIGFVLWQLASASYSSASNDIAQETQQRTIEQLCLTPITLPQLLGIRAFLHVLLGLFVFVLVWTLVYWLTGGRLKGDFVFIVAIAALAVPSLVGVGYAMAGLLLLVKRAEIMHALIYLALISLVALPAYPVNAFSLLPYALGAATAKEVAAGGIVPIAVYGLIAVNSLAYLVIGIGTFIQLERRTRELGTLGHS